MRVGFVPGYSQQGGVDSIFEWFDDRLFTTLTTVIRKMTFVLLDETVPLAASQWGEAGNQRFFSEGVPERRDLRRRLAPRVAARSWAIGPRLSLPPLRPFRRCPRLEDPSGAKLDPRECDHACGGPEPTTLWRQVHPRACVHASDSIPGRGRVSEVGLSGCAGDYRQPVRSLILACLGNDAVIRGVGRGSIPRMVSWWPTMRVPGLELVVLAVARTTSERQSS